MRKEKRDMCIQKTYIAEHTFSGVTEELLDLKEAKKNEKVSECYQKSINDRLVTFIKVNPNRGKPGNKMIESHREFEEIVEKLFEEIGADRSRFHYRRADLSINTDDPNDYYLYRKLYKLIVCCIAIDNNIDNVYESKNLWTCKELNVAVKKDTLEAENYNKEIESHGTVPTTNRLELRSKKIRDNSTLEKEFVKKWCDRLERARTCYDGVRMKYNDNLEKLYKEDLKKPKRERAFLSLNAFLLQYSDCIFDTKQMRDLVSRFDEVANPVSKAKNFKKAHNIEYISQNDLNVVIRALKKKIRMYYRH